MLIIVGIAFISSYAVYLNPVGGTGSSGSSTTTTVPATNFGFAYANAVIRNYSHNLQIYLTCGNYSGVAGKINNITSALESNNSVSNAQAIGNVVQVQTGTMSARQFYNYESSALNSSALACLGFVGTAYVELPQAVNFTISGQSYPIQLNSSMRVYSIPLNLGYSSNVISLKLNGLIMGNGEPYQITVVGRG